MLVFVTNDGAQCMVCHIIWKQDKITHVGFIVLSVKMRIFFGKKCIVLNDVPD